jgi:hypothetical protein
MRTPALILGLVLSLAACSETDGLGEGLAGSSDTHSGTSPDGSTSGSGSGTGSGSGFQSADELGVSVAPSMLTFGSVALGASDSRLVEVRHTGSSGTLELLDVRYVVQEGTDVSLGEVTTTRLEPGEVTEFEVRYAPTDAGQERGTVVIDTNAIDATGAALSIQIPVEAPALTSEFLADAAIVGFGGVATGTQKLRTLTLLNVGTLDVTVDAVSIEGASADEFEVPMATSLPMTVGAGLNQELEVVYTPTGFDTDTATLRLVSSAADGSSELIVALSGHEISAELEVTPSPLNFGLRSPEQPHTEVLTVTSGNPDVDLEISSVTVVETGAWSGTVTVDPWPEGAVALAAGEPLEVSVTFTPSADMLSGPTPIAEIAFVTNDPLDEGVQTVAVYGQRSGTGLEVFPPDIAYFGYVGIGGTVRRDVTLYNAGNAPLTVDSVYVEGDYAVVDGDAWSPTADGPTSAVLEPGALQIVTVSFTTAGPPLETTWGKLIIVSDDAAKPTWEVLLNAQKVEGGDCLLQFVPSALDYGMTAPWTEHTQHITLVNIGSGPCAYHSAITDDCATIQSCEVSADEAMASTSSAAYAVTSQPEVGAEVGPGEMLSIGVTFTAPEAAPVITPYPGMVRARMTSVSGQTGEEVVTVHPSSASWLTLPNLLAEVGVGQLEVTPPVLDFQLVEIGCVSPPTVVTGANVGMAHLEISSWWLEGCSDEVTVLEAPEQGTVHTLQIGQSIDWVLDYAPADESTDTCSLFIVSSDSQTPTEVPVTGWGAYPAQLVDLFTDSEAQKVDVLFVVDDSGSMSEEQVNLSDSFEAFIHEAASWDSDYQIAVTTTTVSLLEFSGGALYGSPPWVTSANWEKFVNIVEVGTGGSGDEQGIWAAYIATSSPLIDPPEGECEVDTDCGLHRVCWLGMCQGVNYGFFRDDAALEVVFVSDEEDHSPEELEAYLNHFRGIKGYAHPELLHIHAIVGPPGGCSSSNGSAEAGHRYMNMADATGGAVYPICELDFAKGLEGIGEIAFASKMEYPLSQTPAPTTIVVTIEGLPCPPLTGGIFNWVYDAEDNTVTLTEEGICTAGSGDEVLIAYDLLCYAEAD